MLLAVALRSREKLALRSCIEQKRHAHGATTVDMMLSGCPRLFATVSLQQRLLYSRDWLNVEISDWYHIQSRLRDSSRAGVSSMADCTI